MNLWRVYVSENGKKSNDIFYVVAKDKDSAILKAWNIVSPHDTRGWRVDKVKKIQLLIWE